MKTTKKRIVIASTVVIGLMFLIGGGELIYTYFDEQLSVSIEPLKEYNDLFQQDSIHKLHAVGTIKSRNRQPVSSYVYDEKFNICVFKVSLVKDIGLLKIISYKRTSLSLLKKAVYSPLLGYGFKFDIKAGRSGSLINSVQFNFIGDSLNFAAKNDNIFCSCFRFNTFSIQYDNSSYDLIAEVTNKDLPANVSFIRKGKVVYVIILSAAKENVTVDSYSLYNLLSLPQV